ncbi:hypothetical protein Agub_g3134 [Astrephomene gubernaculifera]|uniref:Uncharacterized protein n=1 Tax=Astrephomene gubernaculifera TaxID=47775 RepID=A0AAD3DI30_9CHLO|nr:hypothetical protein Agub_g3134 [Astrephomene gubernaculifera]
MTRRMALRFVAVLFVFGHLHACHAIPSLRGIWPLRIQKPAGMKDQLTTRTASVADDAELRSFMAGPAGIAIAARQGLFDYAMEVALMFLGEKLQGQVIPDVSKRFNIPVVGSFDLQLSDIAVTNFTCPPSGANLTILGDGFFHLLAADLSARLAFKWHWSKAGLSGSGEGELLLQGGTIDWVFDVRKDEQLQKPQLQVVTANSYFNSVDLTIHSYAADWLYQAVLSLFNEAVQRQVQNGVSSALDSDVPARLNQVLASLPTRLEVSGLPFSAAFEYSLYTAAYVLVKGYGQVQVPDPAPDALGAAAAGGEEAVVVAAGEQQHGTTQDTGSRVSGSQTAQEQEEVEVVASHRHRHLHQHHHSHHHHHHRHHHRRHLASTSSTSSSSSAAAARSAAVSQMSACPFEASRLPLSSEQLAGEARGLSLYLHEATANCLAWGLFRSGKLRGSIRDGSLPGITITTDVLALLVPQLPTMYPHQHMVIDVEALDSPRLAFSAASGTELQLHYRLSLRVANESLGSPEVVRLAANVSISAQLDWESTVVGEVTAHHVVEASVIAVPPEQWDNTVVWLLQSYGGLLPLRQVVEMLVKTPIASRVALQGAHANTWDRWFGLSADVRLTGDLWGQPGVVAA